MDKHPGFLTETEALDGIAEVLSLKEWDSETPELVAEFVRLSGRRVEGPEERTRRQLVNRYRCQNCGAAMGLECKHDYGCTDADRREPDFPTDGHGDPLAWPDPRQPGWYVDAWNGIYSSKEEALADVPSWVAREEDRKLEFGSPPVFEGDDEVGCQGHPAGPFDPAGVTVYCNGTCRSAA